MKKLFPQMGFKKSGDGGFCSTKGSLESVGFSAPLATKEVDGLLSQLLRLFVLTEDTQAVAGAICAGKGDG